MDFTTVLRSGDDTRAMGQCLARHLPPDAVCLLRGDLAAGKTTLVKAICACFSIPPRAVNSPTYTIANWYEGDVVVCHVDFYRLEDPDELYNLDVADWINPDGPTFIEWPDIALSFLEGIETLEITLSPVEGDQNARHVVISARAETYAELFKALAAMAEERGLRSSEPPIASPSKITPC